MRTSPRRTTITGAGGCLVAAFFLVSCSNTGRELNGVAPQTAAPITLAPTNPSSPTTTNSEESTTTSEQPVSTAATATDPPTDPSTSTTPPTDPPTAAPTEAPTTQAEPVETDPLQPFLDAGFEKAPPLGAPVEAIGKKSGAGARVVQQRLIDLGFWVNGADGDYGLTTSQAVMAFQKYQGIEANGRVNKETARLLNDTKLRVKGTSEDGDLIEVDKTKQLLFIVRGGRTLWALNTSTGNGKEYEEEDKNTPGKKVRGVSLTPNGFHKVNRERPEGWWEGDLGKIYRPKYFKYGVAVHGSGSIPAYPASHGCVRVSVPAMDWIWANDFMPKGTVVWVHGG